MRSNASLIFSVFLAIFFGVVASFLFTPRPGQDDDQLAALSTTPTPRISRAPVSSPAVAGLSSVRISSYGVGLTVAEPISDLVYGEVDEGSGTVAGFTTEKLFAKYPTCKAGALGSLLRFKSGAKRYGYQALGKSIAGYDYYYKKPVFSCVNDQAGRDAIAAAKAALVNSALPTLN